MTGLASTWTPCASPVTTPARRAEMTPAEELREAAKRLREMAATAKEVTHPGHGDWQPWGLVQDTKWEQFPEPHVVTQEEADAFPFGLGNAGDILSGHHVPTGEAFVARA